MKKIIFGFLGIVAALSVASCAKKDGAKGNDGIVTLKGIIDLVPHQEIIDYAAPALLKEGIKVVTLQDASDNLGNEKTANGEADFNYFQHKPYLDSVNKQNGWDLVSVAAIHVEPISL